VSAARKCRDGCGHHILLALIKRKDGSTSWMPLDLKPTMAGNIAVTKDVHGTLHGRVLTGGQGAGPGETRYRSHFMTCLAAEAHRATRGKTPPRGNEPAPQPDPQPTLF
jgi:hypothetical protein